MRFNIYKVIYAFLFIIFIALTLCFGRLIYLLLTFFCFGIIILLIHLKKNDKKCRDIFFISIVSLLILMPVFSFISGMVSYRPKHSYYFYKSTLLKEYDIFNDRSHSGLELLDIRIFMEKQRGQEIFLSYLASDDKLKKEEKIYSDKAIVVSDTDEPVRYENQMYYFALKKYLNDKESNYKIYYTELQDEHQTGVAINKKDNIIVFFDT